MCQYKETKNIYTYNTLRSTRYTQVFLQISFLLTASWRGTPVKPPAFPPFEWWLDPSGSDFPVGERAPAASSGAAPPAYDHIYMYVYIYMYILHQHQTVVCFGFDAGPSTPLEHIFDHKIRSFQPERLDSRKSGKVVRRWAFWVKWG